MNLAVLGASLRLACFDDKSNKSANCASYDECVNHDVFPLLLLTKTIVSISDLK